MVYVTSKTLVLFCDKTGVFVSFMNLFFPIDRANNSVYDISDMTIQY